MNENVLVLTLDSNAFEKMKGDFNKILKRTLGNMQTKGSDEATLTLKLNISLTEQTVPDYDSPNPAAMKTIQNPSEVPSEFSRKICVTFFNKPSDVAKLREGATYTVSVNVESREYNGRWYTDVRAWRLQPKETAQNAGIPPMPDAAPLEEPSYSTPAAEVDDLPF